MIGDYIIDLGLEFGIRTKLAVLVIKQFETKRKREKGGVLLSLRWPLLFLMAGQTPPPRSRTSLLLLFIFFLISITMPNHQAPKTLNFRSAQLENPGVSLSYHQTNPMMRNRGKFRDNPTWFRFIRAVIRAPKREPRPSRATLLLVASNPPQIASKFVTPSSNHEFKSMGERLGRI